MLAYRNYDHLLSPQSEELRAPDSNFDALDPNIRRDWIIEEIKTNSDLNWILTPLGDRLKNLQETNAVLEIRTTVM